MFNNHVLCIYLHWLCFTGSLSGIFRDSFGNVLDLMDEMFEKARHTVLNTPLSLPSHHSPFQTPLTHFYHPSNILLPHPLTHLWTHPSFTPSRLQASYNDEPEDINFIKKHTAALAAKGVERPFSRLFSNPPGTVTTTDYQLPTHTHTHTSDTHPWHTPLTQTQTPTSDY